MSAPEVFKLDENLIARKVMAERIAVFTDRVVGSALTSPLGTLLLACIQAPVTGWRRAVSWLCVINLVELLIIVIGHRSRSARTRGEDTLPWVRWMIFAVFLLGLAWGSTPWFFWTEGKYLYYMVNMLVLIGVVGIDVVIMSPFRMAITLFTGGILLLPMVHVAFVPNEFGVEIAVGLSILLVLVLQHGRVAEKQLIGGLASTVRNAALVGELARRTSDLETSQAELNRAQAVAHVGSWVYDLASDTMRLSAETCRIYGLPDEIASSLDAHIARVHPDDRPRVNAAWRAALKAGGCFDIDYRIVVGDTTRWVRQQAELEFGANRLPIRSVGTIQDITERTLANEALQESRGQFQRVVEYSPLAMALVRNDGTIEYINRKAIETFGYLPQDIPTMDHWWVLAYPDEAYRAEVVAQWMGLLGDALAHNREIERREYRVSCNNGSVKIVAIFGVWIADKVLVIFEDVSERKKVEAEREQLEEQLRESQKMEALGTLAGGVAHDFNNALAAIIGNVELARQDVGPDHAALVSLQEIGKASRRAKDLVQQILAFGRRQVLERTVTSLTLVVVETARLIRATLPAMVTFNVDCRPDTPAVQADATQVKQVLLNLCANALHAVQDRDRPGLIEVRLETHTQSELRGNLQPGRYARLTVRDNGCGMDESTRNHMFEPFFTTKPRGKGTGLGMAVVHGIVKAHDASIEVASVRGEGTEIRVYFPAVDAPVTDAAAPAASATPMQGAGLHILYVDDEESIIFLMTRLLEREGYQVSGYTNPREALAAMRANPDQFDLAVTDYNMPDLSGLDVARELKAIRADLPVVLASGYITDDLRAKAPGAGICELIYKPNTVDDLCESVARIANAQSRTQRSS